MLTDTLRCSAATSAAVLVPDVTTCTSVIHVVDGVLLPGNVSIVFGAGGRAPEDNVFAALKSWAQSGEPMSDVLASYGHFPAKICFKRFPRASA